MASYKAAVRGAEAGGVAVTITGPGMEETVIHCATNGMVLSSAKEKIHELTGEPLEAIGVHQYYPTD